MSTSKKFALLLYTRNSAEVFNRKSALGSYIHVLSTIVSSLGYEVHLNGKEIVDSNSKNSPESKNTATSVKSIFSKFIPKKIKHTIRDQQAAKNTESILNSILENGVHYDVIIEFYSIYSQVGATISAKTRAKLIVIYDGPILEEYTFFNGHQPWNQNLILERQLFTVKTASSVVVYSKPMREFISNALNVEATKIHIHQNIDFSRFETLAPKEIKQQINICFLGSFLKWHRVDLLIEAFDRLYTQFKNQDIHLYLIGDGIEWKNCVRLIDEKKSKTNIHVKGFLDGVELQELKKIMHIGVMPSSNWYGAPNKLFEYGAMGMACIAPRTKTIEDIFPDEVVFFENNDLESFFEAFLKLCMSHEIINTYSKKIYERVLRDFTLEKTRNFYQQLIED